MKSKSLNTLFTKEGIQRSENKVAAIGDFDCPKPVKQPQKLTCPIHNTINKAIKSNDKVLIWDEYVIESFEHINETFSLRVLLNHFSNQPELPLTVGASSAAIGSILQQPSSGIADDLSFFSKTVSLPEIKYSTFDHGDAEPVSAKEGLEWAEGKPSWFSNGGMKTVSSLKSESNLACLREGPMAKILERQYYNKELKDSRRICKVYNLEDYVKNFLKCADIAAAFLKERLKAVPKTRVNTRSYYSTNIVR
uniref:RT_RNaseH_2 domain-containing protein n=1 Tax=Glossina austeni TaxID=7395 RepID=A0A1A9VP51_GLOAU